jgi:hypothetical protein
VALTKVAEATLYAIASTASNAVSVGATVDVSTYNGVDVRIRVGRGTATAFTAAPEIRLEGTFKTSPTANDWVTLASFSPALGASIGSQAVSGTASAGATTVTLAAATNFGANDFVFFHNTSPLANSEWSRVVSIAGAVLTLQEGIVNTQTGATARDQSEEYHALIDATSLQGMRVVVNGSTGTGQAVLVAAWFGAVSGA